MTQPPLNVPPVMPPMPGMPPPGAPPRKGWIRRHLACSITLGCLLVLLVGLGAVGSCVCMVMGMIKSSGAYEDALAAARDSAEVTAALGTPVEAGWFVTGNIRLHNADGYANLAIPVSGPRGKGTLYVDATKSAGKWTLDRLILQVKDGERIDLLKKDVI